MTPTLHDFRSVLDTRGLHAGLKFLNGPVAHRYTGVFQLNNGVFRNVDLYDKEGEVMPEFLAEVPLTDSFCQFVIRDGVFCTDNTSADRRLDGHKYQGVLLTYHGVLVVDNKGELSGTLCHFDADSRKLPDEYFTILQQAARIIPPYLRTGAREALAEHQREI